MGLRTINKGSGTADLCTQASDESSGCPIASTTPVDLTARADNKTGQLSLRAATLCSEQHHPHRNGAAPPSAGQELWEWGSTTISSRGAVGMGQHHPQQQRSCGGRAECRWSCWEPSRHWAAQCPTQLRKEQSQGGEADPQCPPTAACMEARILHPWIYLKCDKRRREMLQRGKWSHIFMEQWFEGSHRITCIIFNLATPNMQGIGWLRHKIRHIKMINFQTLGVSPFDGNISSHCCNFIIFAFEGSKFWWLQRKNTKPWMGVRALTSKSAMPLQNEAQLRSTSTVTGPFSSVILLSACSPFPERRERTQRQLHHTFSGIGSFTLYEYRIILSLISHFPLSS